MKRLAACLLLLLCACSKSDPTREEPRREEGMSAPAPGRKVIPRDEYKALVLSAKGRDDLIAKLGKPTMTSPDPYGDYWAYDAKDFGKVTSFDPVAGKEDERVVIRFDDKEPGKVRSVQFVPRIRSPR